LVSELVHPPQKSQKKIPPKKSPQFFFPIRFGGAEAMGAAEITTEARLATIMASLHESRTLLASSVQRMAVKERKGKVATTATPLLVPDRVQEQPATKSSSSSSLLASQVVAAGAIYNEAALTTTTPTKCSTIGSAVNGGGNHAIVMFPTSGGKHLPSTTWINAENNGLQGAGETGMNMPAGYSTHVLTDPPEGSNAGARIVNTDLLRNTSFPRFDGTNSGLWRVQCLEYFNLFNINRCLWVIAARMHMDGKAKE
jgi:hypothetical protein